MVIWSKFLYYILLYSILCFLMKAYMFFKSTRNYGFSLVSLFISPHYTLKNNADSKFALKLNILNLTMVSHWDYYLFLPIGYLQAQDLYKNST